MTTETVDLDPPGPDQVLYKISGAGLCHPDRSTIENLRPRRLPTIRGHEAAGIVEEVYPGVTNLRPGDHVVSMFVSSCSDCRYCNNGRPNPSQNSSAARDGMFASAGLPATTATFASPHSALVTEEKTIRGSYMGSCIPKRDIPRFIAMYQRGEPPVQELRSGFVTFDQINESFDTLADGAVPRSHA